MQSFPLEEGGSEDSGKACGQSPTESAPLVLSMLKGRKRRGETPPHPGSISGSVWQSTDFQCVGPVSDFVTQLIKGSLIKQIINPYLSGSVIEQLDHILLVFLIMLFLQCKQEAVITSCPFLSSLKIQVHPPSALLCLLCFPHTA